MGRDLSLDGSYIGNALDVVRMRDDAERFIAEFRDAEPELAKDLRIAERELEDGNLNSKERRPALQPAAVKKGSSSQEPSRRRRLRRPREARRQVPLPRQQPRWQSSLRSPVRIRAFPFVG